MSRIKNQLERASRWGLLSDPHAFIVCCVCLAPCPPQPTPAYPQVPFTQQRSDPGAHFLIHLHSWLHLYARASQCFWEMCIIFMPFFISSCSSLTHDSSSILLALNFCMWHCYVVILELGSVLVRSICVVRCVVCFLFCMVFHCMRIYIYIYIYSLFLGWVVFLFWVVSLFVLMWILISLSLLLKFLCW